MAKNHKFILVTGGSGFLGRHLVRRLAERRDPARDRLLLLTRPPGRAPAKSAGKDRTQPAPRAPEPLAIPSDRIEGDVTKLHLGLSGDEYKALKRDVTEIWHLASASDLATPAPVLRAVNLEGTRNVLELARDAHALERLHHFSTLFVSGDREGVILEDELEKGQDFHDAYESSKYQAECLVRRAMPDLPATIYRPGIVIGDSRTGEVDRFEGPYALALRLVASPFGVALPLPGSGAAPLNVIPVDFAADAAVAIGSNPAALGRTIHLVDPAPLSARRVYELIAARAGKPLPQVQVQLPHRAIDALLGLPILERLARPQRNAIRLINQVSVYNCQNQLDLLEGTGLRCPPITTYLDRLISFARQHLPGASSLSPESEEAEDPIDPGP